MEFKSSVLSKNMKVNFNDACLCALGHMPVLWSGVVSCISHTSRLWIGKNQTITRERLNTDVWYISEQQPVSGEALASQWNRSQESLMWTSD